MLVVGEEESYVDEVHAITLGARRFFLLVVGLVGFGVRVEKEGLNNDDDTIVLLFFLRSNGEAK